MHIIKDTACFHVLRRIMSDTLRNTKERLARTYELVDTYNIGGDTKAGLVHTDELVDRSQKSGQRENSTRPEEESRTNVRILGRNEREGVDS